MVDISTISSLALPLFIKRAYRGDEDLLKKYHVVNGNLEFCVAEQAKIIGIQAQYTPLSYYGLCIMDQPIGYMALGKNFLFSYCINISYRTKDVLLDWWKQVVDNFEGHFGTFLYKKNDRALRFLLRNGMEVIKENGNYITLIYTRKWQSSSPQQ